MREYAKAFGKTLRMRNVRQETCAYKAGTLPLYAYEEPERAHDTVNLGIAVDNVESEYESSSSDESVTDSSSQENEESDDDPNGVEMQNEHLSFLSKTPRSGRKITISSRYN